MMKTTVKKLFTCYVHLLYYYLTKKTLFKKIGVKMEEKVDVKNEQTVSNPLENISKSGVVSQIPLNISQSSESLYRHKKTIYDNIRTKTPSLKS